MKTFKNFRSISDDDDSNCCCCWRWWWWRWWPRQTIKKKKKKRKKNDSYVFNSFVSFQCSFLLLFVCLFVFDMIPGIVFPGSRFFSYSSFWIGPGIFFSQFNFFFLFEKNPKILFFFSPFSLFVVIIIIFVLLFYTKRGVCLCFKWGVCVVGFFLPSMPISTQRGRFVFDELKKKKKVFFSRFFYYSLTKKTEWNKNQESVMCVCVCSVCVRAKHDLGGFNFFISRSLFVLFCKLNFKTIFFSWNSSFDFEKLFPFSLFLVCFRI